MADIKSSELENFVGKNVSIHFPKAKDGGYDANQEAFVWYGKIIEAKILSVDPVARNLKIFYKEKEYDISFDLLGKVTYNK